VNTNQVRGTKKSIYIRKKAVERWVKNAIEESVERETKGSKGGSSVKKGEWGNTEVSSASKNVPKKAGQKPDTEKEGDREGEGESGLLWRKKTGWTRMDEGRRKARTMETRVIKGVSLKTVK